MPDTATPQHPPHDLPWREALMWMLLLGSLFVVGYRWTNQQAAASGSTLSLHLPMDDAVPFLAWSIWPYLSLNLIYPCTFFLLENRSALRLYAVRSLLAQSACFAFFLIWPSCSTVPPPRPQGVHGLLFEALRAFEQPCNLFPSLHVAILVLVWLAWRGFLRRQHRRWTWPWDAWCLLILASTVTTHQHDLADIAAGLVIGIAAWWLPAGLRQRLARD